MLLNKWIQFALSAIGGLSAVASSLDWSSVVSAKSSAGIAAGVLVIKAITNVLAPAAGQVSSPTGGSIVTHS